MGEAGNTILFVATLVYTAIVAIYFLAYAAHCFLVVVQDTAAGIDEVAWPDEPISDWVGRAAYLLALVALLLAPAGMLARALRRVWLPADPAQRFLLLAVPGLWLLFPIGLLSAMSSASSWAVLRPAILRQFLRLFLTVAGFYLLTGLLLLAATVAWYYGVCGDGAYLLPVAAGAGAALVLIYARLLGRIGWLIRHREPAEPPPEKDTEDRGSRIEDRGSRIEDRDMSEGRKPEKGARKKARRRPKRAPKAQDPWAVPQEEPRREGLPVEPYGLADDDAPRQNPVPKKRGQGSGVRGQGRRPGPDEIEPYGLADEEPVRPPAPPPAVGGEVTTVDALPPGGRTIASDSASGGGKDTNPDKRFTRPSQPEYIPARPLFSGVFTFPWYGTSLRAWLWLSIGGFAVGVGLRGMVLFWPGS